MSLLTQRALHVYSVLEAYRGANDDIVDALLPFFEPILSDLAGKIYTPSDFAAQVRDAYRWNFTSDIAEELIPRFQRRGWLKQIGEARDERAYQVTYSAQPSGSLSNGVIAIGETLSQIIAEFQLFIHEISPLTGYNRTSDELANILVEWLVSIDAYNEDVLRQQIKTFDVRSTGRLGVAEIQPDEASRLGNDDKYLCARFVRKLYKENSPWLPDLYRIASIGLLTEVIQDFSKPTSAVKRSDLSVYLDGPVALDTLGLSGYAAAENIRPMLTELTRIGCTIRVFRVTVEEIQRALRAMLNRHPADRTGATADAMRRNEVLERYVASVRDRPEHHLQEHGIGVVDQTLGQYPNSHEYFPAELNQELYGAVNWHPEVAPRNHDATVLTLVMRRRGANQSHDAFQTKHLFVTKSGYLSQVARRFCVDRGLINRNQVPPTIHQRQLATMTWLRTGFGTTEEVPKRYLLAACERVLELRRGIVEKAKHAVASLSAEQQQQLELLLTQDRSVQMIMDKTLGSSAVINENNMPQLIEAMKQSLAIDLEKQKRKEVSDIRKDAKARVDAASEARRTAEAQVAAFADQLASSSEDDRRLVESAMAAANRRVHRFRWLVNGTASLLVFGLFVLPVVTEILTGSAKYLVLLLGGIFTAAMGILQIWDRRTGLNELVRWYAHRAFQRLVADRKLEGKLATHSVVFERAEFSLKQTLPPPSNLSLE